MALESLSELHCIIDSIEQRLAVYTVTSPALCCLFVLDD